MVTRIGPRKPPRIFLAEWRESVGLTQEQLANRLETTKATISRWENRERDPPLQALGALAEGIGCAVEDLFHDPGRPSADALLRSASPKTLRLAIKMVQDIVDEAGDGTNG